MRSLPCHVARLFWRIPLQAKLVMPTLLLVCGVTAVATVHEVGSANARTQATYQALAMSKADFLAARYAGGSRGTAALNMAVTDLVRSSPNVRSIAVYSLRGGSATLLAGRKPAEGSPWIYRRDVAGPPPAEIVIQMSPTLANEIRGDVLQLVILMALIEILALLTGIRWWTRLFVHRRLARLAGVAARVADGAREVQVKEADQPLAGDDVSRLGYQLSRMVRTVRLRADRQAELDGLTADAARGLGMSELYGRVAELLARGMGAETTAVYEMFAPSGILILRATQGESAPRQQLALMNPHQFHTRVLAAETPVVGDASVAAPLELGKGVRRVAAIKIPGRQSPYGMLLVASESGEEFSADRLEFLEAVSHTVATTVNALHDPLTALPNRLLFEDRLAQALREARRTGDGVCLYYIDLDNFKEVNDTLGHQSGDQLLRHVSDRLRKVLRASDLLARLGGDEYALVQTVGPHRDSSAPQSDAPEADREAVAVQTATRLLQALAPPFHISSSQFYVSASIGIAIFPEHAADATILSRNADRAMYEAKLEEKGAFRTFTQSMHSAAVHRLNIETGLRTALQREELQLHYQPQVDVARPDQIVGFEALLRWSRPGSSSVAPSTFVPIAEQTGLIVPLGLWALRRASIQAVEWQRRGFPPVRMAVNVAAAQFARPEFVDSVAQILTETGLDPALLELEVTEGSVMRDFEQVIERLNQLRELGVTIAVDDFGTGYSSLAYLNRLPFDALKVDRSFVRGITQAEGTEDGVLVSAIVQLGRSLKKIVVAEGIETDQQLRHLQRLGCDVGQGFLFAQAVSAEKATLMLAQTRDLAGLG